MARFRPLLVFTLPVLAFLAVVPRAGERTVSSAQVQTELTRLVVLNLFPPLPGTNTVEDVTTTDGGGSTGGGNSGGGGNTDGGGSTGGGGNTDEEDQGGGGGGGGGDSGGSGPVVDVNPVPEPATLIMAAVGGLLAGGYAVARRRKK